MGVLCLYAAARPAHLQAGLVVLVVVVGSLALARVIGLLIHGATPYNLGAAAYEIVTTLLAVVALRTRGSEGLPA